MEQFVSDEDCGEQSISQHDLDDSELTRSNVRVTFEIVDFLRACTILVVEIPQVDQDGNCI